MYELELNVEHARRGTELAARWSNLLQGLFNPSFDWGAAEQLEHDLVAHLRRSAHHRGRRPWRVAVAWLRVLRSDHRLREGARTGAAGLADERERLRVLIEDAVGAQSKLDTPSLREQLAASIDAGGGRVERAQLVAALGSLALPTLYLTIPNETRRWRKKRPRPQETTDPELVPVLKLICFLDGTPLVSPQVLRPGPIHQLEFRVKGLRWPSDADALRIQLLSTCPRDCYSVSDFVIPRPDTDGEFEAQCQGNIRFPAAQSAASADLVFRAQCGFVRAEASTDAPVVGHHELRFRVTDQPLFGLQTGHGSLDLHVVNLLQKLVGDVPAVTAELTTLVPVLEALVGVVGVFAQEGMFKGQTKVSEKAFQKEVARCMRMKLGAEVQEHGEQAGGITDIRYRGVIVELKVEKTTGDRVKIAEKYTAQPTQYAGVETRQVSIALVLDLTKKVRPPGDIRNDILLVDVPTHGGADATKTYPSKAFVFVVNGNTRNPSSYS